MARLWVGWPPIGLRNHDEAGYAYHWGYVKIHKEFIAPKMVAKIRRLTVLSTIVDPSLTDYGHRPGAEEEMGSDFNTWQCGQIRQWGKIRPGARLDLPFQTRYIPRYLVLANPGVEVLEWFAADDLSQWDYQMCGQTGTSHCELSASTDPLGSPYQGNLRSNFFYGALMCLKSGWADYCILSVDRVLKQHAFDGVYYDWNLAMYCNNPLHVGAQTNGVAGAKRVGSLASSPTGHWDLDEFLEMVAWTRQRVGPHGMLLLHNTLVPMFATENFANRVVGMEFTYGQLSVSLGRWCPSRPMIS